MPTTSIERPHNCFILPDKTVLLVLQYQLQVYNQDLTLAKEISFTDINPNVRFFSATKMALHPQEKTENKLNLVEEIKDLSGENLQDEIDESFTFWLNGIVD